MSMIATAAALCHMSRAQINYSLWLPCLFPEIRVGNWTELVLLLLSCGTAILGFVALAEPWGFYMGGSFHAIPMWQGVGHLHSNSPGGDYAIYVWFWPYHGKLRQLAYALADTRSEPGRSPVFRVLCAKFFR